MLIKQRLILLFLVMIANIHCIVVKKSDGVVQSVKDLKQSGSDYNYRLEGTHRPQVLIPSLEDDTPKYSVEKIKIIDPKTGRTTLVEKRTGELNNDYSGDIEHFGRAALPLPIIGMRSNGDTGVQVSSSYRNVEQSSGPKYKQTIVTEVNDDQSSKESKDSKSKPLTNRFVPFREPKQRGVMREFSSKTTMSYPDGYAEAQNTRHEESSNYDNGIKVKNIYKAPGSLESAKKTYEIPENVRSSENVNKVFKVPDSVGNSKQKDSAFGDNSIIKTIIFPSDDPLQIDTFDDSVGTDYIKEDLNDGYFGNDGYTLGNRKWSENGFGKLNGYRPVIFDGDSYEKGSGKNAEEAYSSDRGEKGYKGFKTDEEYKKGERKKHGHEESKGEASVKDSEKKSHVDETKEYAEGQNTAQNQKSSDYLQHSGHNKGHKKSGYHKVHHKDEYKNDEEFYDEEHNSGEQKSEGHSSQQNSHELGGSHHNGHLDAGSHEAKSSQSGGREQGKSYKQEGGYKGEKGEQSYHNQQQEYDNKSQQKEKDSGGYKDDGYSRYHHR